MTEAALSLSAAGAREPGRVILLGIEAFPSKRYQSCRPGVPLPAPGATELCCRFRKDWMPLLPVGCAQEPHIE